MNKYTHPYTSEYEERRALTPPTEKELSRIRFFEKTKRIVRAVLLVICVVFGAYCIFMLRASWSTAGVLIGTVRSNPAVTSYIFLLGLDLLVALLVFALTRPRKSEGLFMSPFIKENPGWPGGHPGLGGWRY